MATITVVLLALTLTGSPVVSAACVAACQPTTAAQHSCHEDMAAAGTTVRSPGDACVGHPLDDSPYVVEHRGTADAAVITAALPMATPHAVMTDAPAAYCARAMSPATPPLVLRL